ncbi:MAG TPA: ABC transporter permease, partial [Promineifilum sp.]|nr:ABC transporter permease [Promineifilum sp.]
MAEQSKRSPLYTSATIDVADVVSRPALIIEPARGHFSLQLDRLWAYRELLYFLVWRDVKVRYKQTALGVAWVVLQPLLTT